MKKYTLEITVFICGASLMILELAGSRLLSPYVGTSLIVWTTLIGMVMGFLSLGYWYGGRLADRKATAKTLAAVIFFSAFSVFFIIIVNKHLLQFISRNFLNVYLNSILSSLLLFALPGFLLGIVSPYAARLKMESLESSGRTVGNLYALSTIGSIVGTFSAGFLLIPFFGTIRILYLIVIFLIIASLLIFPFKFFKIRSLLIGLVFLGMLFSFWQSAQADPNKFVEVDTIYNRIWIFPGRPQNNRPVLNLSTDPFSVQSGMYLDKDDDLVFRYARYYRMADYFKPDIKNGLVIGGAAYSYPRDFLQKHPNANLDVVEIDPGMTKIAKKYFNLKDDPRLNIYHEDGRIFLNNNKKKYDAIYLDAFNSHLSIPYQLTTKEAVVRIYDSLSDDGVAIINIISSLEGERSDFLRAEYATYKEIFPQLYLFRVYGVNPAFRQNLILVALKKKHEGELAPYSAEIKNYLDMEWRRGIKTDLPVLTDDYAPVDYYTIRAM